MEQIEILETIIVLLCVVVGALVVGMIAIMIKVSENIDNIYDINERINRNKRYIEELEKTADKIQKNKKDKSKEAIILEDIEKNRATLEKNINNRLNK